MALELRLILAILAVYRLSVLLPDDDGPLFVFRRIREFFDERAAKEQLKTGSLNGIWSNVSEGITCAYCMGLYMSVLCSVLVYWPSAPGDIFLILFALAGGQSVLQRLTS